MCLKKHIFLLPLIILAFVFLNSCESEKEAQDELITGQMNRCFENEISVKFAEAVSVFEKRILEHYDFEKENLSEAYKKYVEEINSGIISTGFYIESGISESLDFIKKSGLIERVYIIEEYPGAKIYYINKESKFSKCLQNNSLIRAEERKFLKTHLSEPNTSPKEISGHLIMSFLKDSYNISINRVMIVFFLYYPGVLSLNSSEELS